MKNLRKWPIFVFFLNLLELGAAGTAGAAVCAKKLSEDCTLSAYYLRDSPICAEVFFSPPKLAYFLSDFLLVPLMKNLRKWPILLFLLNLIELGAADTVRASVCANKLSYDFTLSALFLSNSPICAELFFRPPKSAYFLSDFSQVPPIKNLRKWKILVFFLNLLELGAAGTVGAAVCA